MKYKLKTDFIYIDTSIFYSNNFNFSNKKFLQLEQYIQSNNLSFLINTITINETKNNITKNANEAQKSISSISKKIKILNNVDSINFHDIFKKDSFDIYRNELLSKFEIFLKKTNSVLIPTVNDSIEGILDDYFSRQPPFDKDDKKSEFPDALMFYSLLDWCKKNNSKCYLITNDNDFTRIVEKKKIDDIIIFNSLEEFLDLVTNNIKSEEIKNLVYDNIEIIKTAIEDLFYDSGYYVDHHNAEIDGIVLSEIDINEVYILSIIDELISIQIDTSLSYDSVLSVENYDNAFYDEEDKKWYNVAKYKSDYSSTIDSEFIFEIKIDKNLSSINIISLNLSNDEYFEIHYSPEDDYPYK